MAANDSTTRSSASTKGKRRIQLRMVPTKPNQINGNKTESTTFLERLTRALPNQNIWKLYLELY
jgi:hypothetical protein